MRGYEEGGVVWSMERGIWNCSDITEPMGMSDSDMNKIMPKSSKYAEKAPWDWYTRKSPGSGTNICWKPDVRYLESGSN